MAHKHAHHGHDHHPSPGAAKHDIAFAVGIALNTSFVVLEISYGLIAHSTALVADAIHNLGDVAGLALAWFASWLARRAPGPRFTYGLRSSTILAALANAVLMLLACGGLALEAVQRLLAPAAVAGQIVIWVALAGVCVNGVTALFFFRDRKHDLNVRGAYLHMAADALVSLGVAISGYVIVRSGWNWLDPLASITILVVILLGTWQLLRDSALLSLHAVPAHLDSAPIAKFLEEQAGVTGVHDLHVWALSTTDVALTAHLVMPGGHPGDAWLNELAHALTHAYDIGHATFQVETGMQDHACTLVDSGCAH